MAEKKHEVFHKGHDGLEEGSWQHSLGKIVENKFVETLILMLVFADIALLSVEIGIDQGILCIHGHTQAWPPESHDSGVAATGAGHVTYASQPASHAGPPASHAGHPASPAGHTASDAAHAASGFHAPSNQTISSSPEMPFHPRTVSSASFAQVFPQTRLAFDDTLATSRSFLQQGVTFNYKAGVFLPPVAVDDAHAADHGDKHGDDHGGDHGGHHGGHPAVTDEKLVCDHPRGPHAGHIAHQCHTLSVLVLVIFAFELFLKYLVNPVKFCSNRFEVLDAVVVVVSLILDVVIIGMIDAEAYEHKAHEDPDELKDIATGSTVAAQTDPLKASIVLLLIIRCWRVVRIVHGLFEYVHHEQGIYQESDQLMEKQKEQIQELRGLAQKNFVNVPDELMIDYDIEKIREMQEEQEKKLNEL